MKTIRLSYAPLYNAGDLFNKDLVEKLSGKEVVNSKMYNADMIVTDGILIGFGGKQLKIMKDNMAAA